MEKQIALLQALVNVQAEGIYKIDEHTATVRVTGLLYNFGRWAFVFEWVSKGNFPNYLLQSNDTHISNITFKVNI